MARQDRLRQRPHLRRRRRQEEGDLPPQPGLHTPRRLQEGRQQRPDLPRPAPRQDRHAPPRPPRQRRRGLGPRGRGLLHQWVAHVHRPQARPRVKRRLKREDAQQQVEGPRHPPHAPPPPHPHLRRDVMRRPHPQRPHPFGQRHVEGIVIQRHQQIRPPRGSQRRHVRQRLPEKAQPRRHLHHPHRPHRVGVVKQVGPLGAQRVAAHPPHLDRPPRETGPQGPHQRAPVHVAGDLPGGDHHLQRRCAHSASRVTIRSGALTPPSVT